MHKIFTKTLFLGKKLVFLPSCHSTNDIASDLLAKGLASEGTLVYTANQTAGRGQRGNLWEAEPGQNLTMSLILKPDFLQIREQFFLQMAISLALADTVRGLCDLEAEIKWPNDIYVDHKKIAGILIENTLRGPNLEYAVVGIGLNVNQKLFGYPQAGSLSQLTDQDFDLDGVMEALVLSIEVRYLQLKQKQTARLKTEYLNRMYWFGEKRHFKSDFEFEGVIQGIEENGRLQVMVNGHVQTFDMKEIVFVS